MNENHDIHENQETQGMPSVINDDNGNDSKKIDCDTAGDLLPLYVDEVLSSSSAALVEAHLAECESCTEKVNALKKETAVKDYDGAKPMKKFKKQFRRHKIITGVLIAICVIFLVGIFLRVYHYDYTYDQLKKDIEVVSDSDGHVRVVYNGDKILFTNHKYVLTGIKDGKAQYTLVFYETVGAYDLYCYYFKSPPLMMRPYHEEGRKFELVKICPNDKEYNWYCHICENDERYIENLSLYDTGFVSYMGLYNDNYSGGIDHIYNYDKPNPYTWEEWDQLDFVNPDTDPYYDYELMEAEINRVVYCNFNGGMNRCKTYTIWEKNS